MPEEPVVKETIIKEPSETQIDFSPVISEIDKINEKLIVLASFNDSLGSLLDAIYGNLTAQIENLHVDKIEEKLATLATQIQAIYNSANNATTTAEGVPDKVAGLLDKAVGTLSAKIETMKPQSINTSTTDEQKAVTTALNVLQDKIAVIITEISKDDKKPISKEDIKTIEENTVVTQATTKEITTQLESISSDVNDIKEAL